MAKLWAEVAKSDGYRALSSVEREEARNEYWREVVEPRMPVAELICSQPVLQPRSLVTTTTTQFLSARLSYCDRTSVQGSLQLIVSPLCQYDMLHLAPRNK